MQRTDGREPPGSSVGCCSAWLPTCSALPGSPSPGLSPARLAAHLELCLPVLLGLTDSPLLCARVPWLIPPGLSRPALCLTGWFLLLSPHLSFLVLPAVWSTYFLPLALMRGLHTLPPAQGAAPQRCSGCRQVPGIWGQPLAGMPPLPTIFKGLLPWACSQGPGDLWSCPFLPEPQVV